MSFSERTQPSVANPDSRAAAEPIFSTQSFHNAGGMSSNNAPEDGSAYYVSIEERRRPEEGLPFVDLSSCLHYIHKQTGTVVHNPTFQQSIVLLIVLNSISMGIATFDFVTEHPTVDRAFETVDRVFLWIFTLELGLQLGHHGLALFQDSWLVFDFIIIACSWAAFASLQILRAFRIFRALRLVTRVQELKDLVQVLLSVIPRMFAIGTLLLLFYYIFAVMFTTQFKSLYRDGLTSQDYFSRLDKTIFTLFQLMTMENWSQITKEVMETYSWAWLPIISFILVSSFVVVNLVIGVICDAVAGMHQEQAKQQMVEFSSLTSNAVTVHQKDFLRMEQKMEDLANNLKTLMEQQRQLQQDLRQLQEQTPSS